jgi:hypothetical protein
MSTAFAAPQFSIADLWEGLKALAFRMVANPNIIAKVQAAWDAVLTAYQALFPAPVPAADANDTAIVEGWLTEAAPGKLFDGKILQFIAGISAFLDTHPQLVALFLQLIAMLPKETEVV